ncbi:MAG TPA: tetratricopeptide repeat protein, partial [Gemmataceae bacterium]|nr:tetratricopeptide repeat protein [Gemmataceae bacterium]
QALADLERADRGGAGGTAVSYQRALIHMARQDRLAALASLREAVRLDPGNAPARELLARLQADR